ncbi:MAG TPA: ABC transporter permease [Blastocatellia bacterium]|nr:ABC transporter permease [Blastocatellia bacterium]
MPLLPRLSSLWRNLFHKARKDQELTEEIEAYLEMLVDRKIKEGFDPAEALRASLIELGGREQVKEKVREARSGYQLETLWQDLRYALRMLLKNPAITLIAIFTLALGIGANTAIFSVVNSVLLNPVPYYEPQRLLWVTEAQDGRVRSPYAKSYLFWRAQSQVFEHLVAYNRGSRELTGRGEPERLESLKVTANVFPALGLAPQLGRAFTAEDDRPEAAPVALLSHALWVRGFGGDPAIIGQSLTLGDQSWTVIGIMPPRSRSLLPLERADVWLPLAIDVKDEDQLRDHQLNVIGRLKPGFTPEQADAEVSLIMRRLVLATPGIMYTEARAILLIDNLVGKLRRGLLALFGAVALVLLIACANVANLLLGRVAMRQKEMAIRAAMGAGRARLVRQMLTESLLLSLLGGATGLLLAVWGVKALVALAPDQLRHIRETSVDGAALGFTFLAALLTGLAAGIIPALQSSQIDLNEALKEGARRAATFRRRGLGRVSPTLVIGEVALTLVLLTGAGLVIKSYLRVLAVDPGYDPKNLLALRIELDEAKYPRGSPQLYAFNQEALTQVKAIPGVKAVAAVFGAGIPFTATGGKTLFSIEGRAPWPSEQRPQVDISHISPDYFRTMGMRLRAGRGFTEQDEEKAPRVVIINEMMARRYFSGEDPLGKRIFTLSSSRTIVGVVGDVKRFGLEAEAPLEIYVPYLQERIPTNDFNLAARTAGDPLDLVAAVRQKIYEIEPAADVRMEDQRLAETLAPRRFQAMLSALSAAVALVLAAVGVYGVIAYSVSRRTHEIGIRMALGARPRDVLLMVMRQGMTLALVGVAIGLAVASGTTRVLKGLLFELSVTDPPTFALIAALMLGVAFLACYLPARRATTVDPMIALRQE